MVPLALAPFTLITTQRPAATTSVAVVSPLATNAPASRTVTLEADALGVGHLLEPTR